jgi:3-dehydroquinate dehydratase/shikimate dehydrogenase
MVAPTLRTQRLLLRGWQDSDREPFAVLNSDPEVMEHFPATLSRDESDAFVDRVVAQFEHTGWGLWAVEVVDEAEPVAGFVGYVGLWSADHVEPLTVEIGWRLSQDSWGRGYAAEAAAEALRHGFETIGLPEIVSFTVPQNARSRRVMEKIGLRRRSERDFDHPRMDPDVHPHLVAHVLYSVTRSEWQADREG